MSSPEKYGKRRQISFRIGPLAQERLEQVAALFNMKPTQYAKAVLYQHLGIFNEPLDRRRRTWKRKKRRQQQEEEEQAAFESDALSRIAAKEGPDEDYGEITPGRHIAGSEEEF